MSQISHTSAPVNVFDAAKAIAETLKNLEKQLQIQALRFASESLGLSSSTAVPSSGNPSEHHSTHALAPVPGARSAQADIKTFTAQKSPKSDQQFAAVVAYFNRFEVPEPQRKETIDAATLIEAARQAGRKRPEKPGMTLHNAKNAGYLDAVGKAEFKINSVGENLVAMTLPGDSAEGSNNRGANRRRRRTSKKTALKKPVKNVR